MSKLVRITCAIVDTQRLTMYKEDGETIIINQGDVRMKRIVDDIGPQLLAKGYADVDLSGPPVQNSYKDFEEKSSGVVKLFRIAKSKLASIFRADDLMVEIVDPVQLGQVPAVKTTMADVPSGLVSQAAEAIEQFGEDELERFRDQKALADFQEVMQHATPVTAADFDEDNVAKQGVVRDERGHSSSHEEADAATAKDTIIAVVDNKIVPGVEKIKSQFAHASKNGTAAVEAFLSRVAGIERKHSVEDLLKFMERGDLPIAEDGSIIIYKLLKTKGNDDGTFYDVHSGNVPQKVGSYVCMDEKMVDHNRHQECSNGLHVARRGYLGSFSGNIMVLAKVAPEDVIAVPHGDANKMRVCGYHIIMRLPENLKKLLQSNNPMTGEPEGKSLLAAAIAGKHIGRIEEVRIRGSYGGDVLITPLGEAAPVFTSELETVLPTEKVEAAVALEADKGIKEVAPAIDPNEVAKEVNAVLSRKEQAKLLYADWRKACPADRPSALAVLLAFKKAAKVGWDRLGIPDPETQAMVCTGNKPVKEASIGAGIVKAKAKPAVVEVPAEGSARDRILKYLRMGITTQAQAQQIISIKRAAKKSWEVLGVDEKAVAKITKLAGK